MSMRVKHGGKNCTTEKDQRRKGKGDDRTDTAVESWCHKFLLEAEKWQRLFAQQ